MSSVMKKTFIVLIMKMHKHSINKDVFRLKILYRLQDEDIIIEKTLGVFMEGTAVVLIIKTFSVFVIKMSSLRRR